jgi:threonine/homoserine/homoserine lactone efflux protein
LLAVGAMSAFTLPDRAMTPQVLMIAAVLGALGFAAQTAWLGSGVLAARYLKTERALRIFNIVLGGLCIASVIFIFV